MCNHTRNQQFFRIYFSKRHLRVVCVVSVCTVCLFILVIEVFANEKDEQPLSAVVVCRFVVKC
jgi:hypothetical protein